MIMKKIFSTKQIFLLLLILIAKASTAQTTLSLNDAIEKAIANRYDLKIQQVNTDVTKKQLNEVQTRSLPQITSDLDLRYNTKLQSNVLPGYVFAAPNSPDKLIQLGTKYNFLWGFNLNQNIYNPTNISDRKIATLQTEYQKQNEKLTETNIKQEVTEAYFSALLWKEKIKLSEQNVKRANSVYQTSQNQLSMGQATNYDVQRNEVDLENAKATDEQNKRSYELSVNDLLYKISGNSIKNPVLSDNLTDLMQQYSNLPMVSGEIQRTELLQQELQTDIYNQNIKKQKLIALPTVSAYGNYSLQYLHNGFTPLTVSDWYPFNYVGVKASFSLFDGGFRNKTKQEYELRAQASKYNYDKLSADYQQEVLSTQTTLYNSLSDLNYQKKNLALIEDLYRIDTDRFENGTIKQSDLTTTYYTLLQTQTNYLNSVYNYLVAVVSYKKAVGTL